MPKSKNLKATIPEPNLEGLSVETLAIRSGQIRSPELEHSEAIFPTSSFVFNSAEEAAQRFSGDIPGNVYARFTNPTVTMLETRIAALEGGERAVATASGMSAIMATFMAVLKQGDHVLCSRSVFGTTTVFLEKFMSKFGVDVEFVDLVDYEAWESGLKQNTRVVFVETPSNPLCEVVDLERLRSIIDSKSLDQQCLFIVDNCFCTPALQQPLSMGADIIIHSATKYIDGQGRCLGGLVVGSNELMAEVHGYMRSAGPAMSPFNAWVFLKGLETLSLRMKAHSENALKVARWLEQQPQVEQVFYAGLESHPYYELAKRQQKGASGVLSFRVKGGREQAWNVIDGVEFLSLTANLGDAKTTITHPATTTHGRLSDEEKARAGITENLIRVSVGLESADDVIADLEKGLASI
ncbi:O-succinylhomoserine sulfhydrylase [Oleiphilus sp. HI0009]|uniref:O-succinylhomoserine sulfhydrylase n=2 Tax=Oleiphilus TaxID=141450 RepID=UPI0007C2A352|nr:MULTISPECIES: O-succinylhomoserine sulfhydrylase [unclassified Oleiphilus]KZX76009.1 O-succinylhomoserine sulfhydrylase [Oleiphilus sp. HI0009]KZY65106.1 O-succinylhomoserine sulfhydrylase [Oleiphilus sp. HI0066]KZY71205.1 O-succinylhomoserine sulfhydrylase [Oleiphilus sp. HI0067]